MVTYKHKNVVCDGKVHDVVISHRFPPHIAESCKDVQHKCVTKDANQECHQVECHSDGLKVEKSNIQTYCKFAAAVSGFSASIAATTAASATIVVHICSDVAVATSGAVAVAVVATASAIISTSTACFCCCFWCFCCVSCS